MKNLMTRKEKIIRLGGYLFYGVVVFLLFVMIVFPYDKLKNRIVLDFEERVSGKLFIEKIQPALPLGIKLSGVKIKLEGMPEKSTFFIKKIKISLDITSLLIMRPTLAYQVFFKQGKGDGTVYYVKRERVKNPLMSLTISNLDLKEDLPGTFLFGRNVTGMLNGSFEIEAENFDLYKAHGSGSFNLNNGVIGMEGNFPDLYYDNLDASFEISKRTIQIKQAIFEGKDLDSKINGKIILMKPLDGSNISLRLKVRPSLPFQEQNKNLFVAAKRFRDREGFFTMLLGGTIRAPHLNMGKFRVY